jgi:hypothetical protein
MTNWLRLCLPFKPVRVRNGKKQVTDGPFAETTEQPGGYYIIDVEDLDEALSIASRLHRLLRPISAARS